MKIIMSTPINGETYRFSSAVGLTVRLSVRLSVHYTFVSELYLFEPLVGFSNTSAQMSSMMSRRAVRMFDQGRFKVIVIVQG